MNYNTELYHQGVKGMKWGVRRYQNADGSLTPRGKKKYLNSDGSLTNKGVEKYAKAGYMRDLRDRSMVQYKHDPDAGAKKLEKGGAMKLKFDTRKIFKASSLKENEKWAYKELARQQSELKKYGATTDYYKKVTDGERKVGEVMLRIGAELTMAAISRAMQNSR